MVPGKTPNGGQYLALREDAVGLVTEVRAWISGSQWTGVAAWSPSPKGWPEGPRAERRDAGPGLGVVDHATS